MTDATQQPDPFSELRGLIERASPTPWVMGKHEQVRSPDGRQVSVWGAGIAWASRDTETEANGALLVAAVNSLGVLLDERDRLIERTEKLSDCLVEVMAARERELKADEAVEKLKERGCTRTELERAVHASMDAMTHASAVEARARQALSQEIG